MDQVISSDICKEINEELIKTIEKIKKISIDRATVSDETFLGGDLGIDSIELLEALYDIQKQFGIKIPEDQIGELYTVGDAVKMIVQFREQS